MPFAATVLAVAALGQAQPEESPGKSLLLVLSDAGEPPPDGLLLALRVQLGAEVRVEARTLPAQLDLAAHEQAARSMLLAEHARAAVWAERVDGGRRVHVWRAAADGSAPLVTADVAGTPGPDMDRTLALKVSEVLATAAQAAAPASQPSQTAPPSGAAPPALGEQAAHGEAAPSTADSWRLGVIAQLAAVALPDGDGGFGQLGPALAVGATLGTPSLRCAALIDVGWLSAERVHARGAIVVDVQQLQPALRLHAQKAFGALWLGAYAALALAIVHAEAWTTEAHGEATETPLSWLAGIGVELPLTTAFALALDVGLQAQLRRQRFSVLGAEVADSKRLRPLGRLAISFRPSERK